MEVIGVKRLCCAVRFMSQTVCIKPRLICMIRAHMPGKKYGSGIAITNASDQTTISAFPAYNQPPKLYSLFGFHSILLADSECDCDFDSGPTVTVTVTLTLAPL